MHNVYKKESVDKCFRLVAISNVILEPYFSVTIGNVFFNHGLTIKIDHIQLSEIQQSSTKLSIADIVLVIIDFQSRYCDDIKSLSSVLQDAKYIYDSIKSICSSHIIWFGFEEYFSNSKNHLGHVYTQEKNIERINIEISQHLQPSDVFIDFNHIIAEIGISRAYSVKNKYRWNSPYSKELVNEISNEIYKQVMIHTGITPKCIVLDCDNVLWGGVISEDGIEGIQISDNGLGRPFQDFQRYLLDLYHHGVILTICSKNDEADVLKVFREHSGMLLNEEHIAVFECSWDAKANGIIKISEALNLELNSIVFIDDSDFETGAVNSLLPEVIAITYNRNTIYEQLSCFNLKRDTDIEIIRERNNTYKTNALRRKLELTSPSFDDYIQSLNICIDIHSSLPSELGRISELTLRTNKCTNGKRYTLEQLKMKIGDNSYSLYSVYVSDKFSNLGLVGAFGVKNNTLDLFSLSCRSLGRNVEDTMVEFICKIGVTEAYYKSTSKNLNLYYRLLNKINVIDI